MNDDATPTRKSSSAGAAAAGPLWRCEICRLSEDLCICDRLPRLELPIRFIFVRHVGEEHSQSNTGGPVQRMLADSRLLDYQDVMRDPSTDLWEPDVDHHVLFPQPGARPVSPESLERSAGRPALIVLDGSWRRARRMSRRIPGIRRFPFLALPAGPPRIPPLRRPTRPGQLSTGEAVARALELLGHENEARAITEFLALLSTRVLRLRGKIPRAPTCRREDS